MLMVEWEFSLCWEDVHLVMGIPIKLRLEGIPIKLRLEGIPIMIRLDLVESDPVFSEHYLDPFHA